MSEGLWYYGVYSQILDFTMTEKLTTTPRDELESLKHEAGRYPAAQQPFMLEALNHVPGYWNAAAADHSFDVLWREGIRQQLCHYALVHLSSETMSPSLKQDLKGSIRQNLINLGNKQLAEVTVAAEATSS